MCMGSAWNVDPGGEQDIAFQVHASKMAARPDINVVVQPRLASGEDRSEFDSRRERAAVEHEPQESAPQVLARYPRDEGQRLRRAEQRSIAAEQDPTHLKRNPRREHRDEREAKAQTLQRLSHLKPTPGSLIAWRGCRR